MATPVIIPKLGNTVESCIIGSWKRKEGEEVKKEPSGQSVKEEKKKEKEIPVAEKETIIKKQEAIKEAICQIR